MEKIPLKCAYPWSLRYFLGSSQRYVLERVVPQEHLASRIAGRESSVHIPSAITGVLRQRVLRITIVASIFIGSSIPLADYSTAAQKADTPSGEPVQITVGYQPYYSGSWSALVVKNAEMWKKYLPAGSTVTWEVGLQGAVITNNMLAGKYQFGYVGDMPAIVATTKRSQADIRMIAVSSFQNEQCNNFVVRPDAPQFKTPKEALKWFDGKRVAVPKGSCADRFAQEVFRRENIKPSEYLNESIEVITTNLRAGKLDAAVIWEPNVAHVSALVGNSSARLVSTGADWGLSDSAQLVVSKEFLDKYPAAVVGFLKAEIEAQRFIVSNYPKNACQVADYAVSDSTGYDKKQMWQALYGTVADGEIGGKGIRWQAQLGYSPTVRAFLDQSSRFLLAAGVISSAMPKDAILDGPLNQAMKEMAVRAPLGQTQQHRLSEYPCK